MISSSHEVVTKIKVSIPSFLSWFLSIAYTLCKVDPPPSGATWAKSLTAKWSTTLA